MCESALPGGVDRAPRPTDEFTVEMLYQLSSHAADMEEYQTALDWLDLAQRLAPESARLYADRAYACEQLGLLDDADAAHKRAVALDTSGEAQFCYAVFAYAWRHDELAADLLVRAMELDPIHALDVDTSEADWSRILNHPRVRKAKRRALELCG